MVIEIELERMRQRWKEGERKIGTECDKKREMV